MLRRHPVLSLLLVGSGVYAIASSLFARVPTDTVDVDSLPRGALVVVDGKERGMTPVALDLSAGSEHTILIVREGYVAVETLVQPVFGWGLVGSAVCNGLLLGLAQAAIEVSRGGGRHLEPSEVHVRLAPAKPATQSRAEPATRSPEGPATPSIVAPAIDGG